MKLMNHNRGNSLLFNIIFNLLVLGVLKCDCVSKIFIVDIFHIKLTRDNMSTKLYAITFFI